MPKHRRMAQFRPARLADHIIFVALVLFAAGLAMVLADTILGPENVTYWLASLIS